MLIALVIMGGVALFTTLMSIVVMLFLLVQSIRDIRDIRTLTQLNTNRLSGMERILVTTHTMLAQEISGAVAQQQLQQLRSPALGSGLGITQRNGKFMTDDGIHEADTFEELMHKISQDSRYRVAKEEDIEKLRRKFEEYEEENGEEENGEEEDDWNKDVT